MIEKFFLKIFAVAFLINCLAVSSAQASIETVTGTGEYIMSMKETPEFAQQNAKLYAERAAIEQAGIFIASVSISKNFQLQDEITTFAAGLLKKINVVENKMIPLTGEAAGYIKVVVTVEAQVDTDDFETALEKWQNKDGDEKSNLVEQDKSQQKLIEEQVQRVKKVEQNLENIKTEQDKQNVQQELKQIDKNALYIQKIDEGWKCWKEKNFDKALEIFDEAVELNQNNYQVYFVRGTAYVDLKQYEKALPDLNKAIELNPNFYQSYYTRGLIYLKLKKYDAVISDYSKAIEIIPNYWKPYNNRGNAYFSLKKYKKALDDYSKSIELNPSDISYYNRGNVYVRLRQYRKAIDDYSKAIELNPNNPNLSEVYYNRGLLYKYYLKYLEKAEADFAKAQELRKGRELGRF